MSEKNYLSFTGLKDFYYGILKDDKLVGAAAERVKNLQEIAVSTGQELIKAHGDNKVAEMAVATEETTVTTTFHTIPIEDRAALYGMISKGDVYAMPANPSPPYVACMFTKTKEDGTEEHVGFVKGKFMIADEEAVTKGETIDFGQGTTEGEFMSREVEGYDEEISMLVTSDAKGETTGRDELYQSIFGVTYPVVGA